ncbi:MAG: ABC transporter permease [Xylophilus ampelinus]
MLPFLLRRTLSTLPVLLLAALLAFALTRLLPGDPAAVLAAGMAQAGPEDLARLRAGLGLDRPLPAQFAGYLAGLARGDWGRSFTTGQPVAADLAARAPASLELACAAFGLAAAAALPLGIAAALRPGRAVDHACRALCVAGGCLPAFVTGLALIAWLYLGWGWAPEPIGRIDPLLAPPPARTGFLLLDAALAGDGAAWRSAAAHLLLPALALALSALAPLARTVRAAMRAVLGSDAIRTARALGLPWRTVVLGRALRLAMPPVATVMGLVLAALLGASVAVEKLFAWPGIGSYALDALMAADHAPVQGFVLLAAALFAGIHLAVDLLCLALDPRLAEDGRA